MGHASTGALQHPCAASGVTRTRQLSATLPPIDTDRLILIVTGAHLRAEASDRPLAYRLAEKLRPAIAKACDEDDQAPGVLVCSDIWWLNNDALRTRPTISIGAPDVNALTAYLADKLPFVYSIEGQLGVQMDLDFVDPWATIWGVSERTTTQAVEAFEAKYLDHFAKGALSHKA